MKRIILLPLIAVSGLMAHPAKKVTLSLNNDTLKVVAQHPVKDPKKHYISEIDITVGDSIVSKNKYEGQTNKDAAIETFILPKDLLVDGAVITVKTDCSKFGAKKGTLVVGEDKIESKEDK